MDICEHLQSTSVGQLLPDLVENSTYVVPCNLTLPGIPVMYLRSLVIFLNSNHQVPSHY